jgi:PqqD family protein of HPr-rel-A system
MNDRGPRRRHGVVKRTLEDECLLYDETRGRIHVLNAVAAEVWEMCDGTHSLEAMADAVRAGYDVPGDVDVVDDIRSVLATLARLDLLDLRADA